MIETKDQNKALRITAVVTEWNGENTIEIENVAAASYEHRRVRIVTDNACIEVSAWGMIRAIKACGQFFDE